jgi:hypothetical protein
MPRSPFRLTRIWLLLSALAAVVLSGCDDDKIATYPAPRSEPPPSVRLLAAIIPDKTRTWFFKLSGPRDQVGQQQEAFEKFVRSVRFTGKADPPLTWSEPDGWQKKAGKTEDRFATFQLGDKDHPLEVTVVSLEGEGGTLLGNVNRWREQIGLRAIQGADLDMFTREEKRDDATLTFVDMVGPGKARAPAEGGTGGLHYSRPEGWEQLPPDPKGLYVVGFRAGEGNRSAEITVTMFPGEAGGMVPNILRWRRQLGMEDVSEAQVRQDIQSLPVAGVKASYVDLTGPALGGQPERILGVIVTHGARTWFLKMKGPADVVGRQKNNFEAFAGSLRLDGGKGATK